MILPTMTNKEISSEIDRDLSNVLVKVYPTLNKYRKLANRLKPKERRVYLNSKTVILYNNNKHYFICGADKKGFLYYHFIFNGDRLISIHTNGYHVIYTAHFLQRFRERCSFNVNTHGILISLSKIMGMYAPKLLQDNIYASGEENRYIITSLEDNMYTAITFIEGDLTHKQQKIVEDCKKYL